MLHSDSATKCQHLQIATQETSMVKYESRETQNYILYCAEYNNMAYSLSGTARSARPCGAGGTSRHCLPAHSSRHSCSEHSQMERGWVGVRSLRWEW